MSIRLPDTVAWTLDSRGYRNKLTRRGGKRLYESEHVRVWEDFHKMAVPPGFQIHHIDGNRVNNVPENLIALDPQTHQRIHQGWIRGDNGEWLKPCSKCGEKKPLDAFGRKGNSQYQWACRECRKRGALCQS